MRGRWLPRLPPSARAADGLQPALDLGELFCGALDLGSLEPISCGEEPVATGVEQDYGDRHDRVVERGQRIARRELREHEEDGDEGDPYDRDRSEEHTSELQSPCNLVCRLLLE